MFRYRDKQIWGNFSQVWVIPAGESLNGQDFACGVDDRLK